jgi:hypothetical protein
MRGLGSLPPPSATVSRPPSTPTSHHAGALLFSSTACCCTASPPIMMPVHLVQALQTRTRAVLCTASTFGLDPCAHPRRFSAAHRLRRMRRLQPDPGGAQRATARSLWIVTMSARCAHACCSAPPPPPSSSVPWSITTLILRALTALVLQAFQAICGAPTRTCWLLLCSSWRR